MIEVYLQNNVYRVSGSDLASLAGIKPYIVHQTTLKLIHSRSIDQPYKQYGGYYHSQLGFTQLAQHLNIPADVYDSVIQSFQAAEEANRKR